jgi:hypothetical protein
MARGMGFDFGLEKPDLCLKRKFRWLFKIPEISADGVNSLPPEKGARPSLSFKEIEVQHLNEVIYFPGKPDWKPINLTLYDIRKNENPVIKWLSKQYNPKDATWKVGVGWPPPANSAESASAPDSSFSFKKTGFLDLYDGCGKVIETWKFENIWPNNIEWGELDMSDNSYVTVDLTLRYDRAYLI